MVAYMSRDFCRGFCTNNQRNMCQVALTIYQVVVKGYHRCPFAADVKQRFFAQKKKGDCGNTLKVINKIHHISFVDVFLFFKKNLQIDDNR